MRPSTSEAPAALLPPPPLQLLPGGAIQFPGGFVSRCGSAPFHGALQSRRYANRPIRGLGEPWAAATLPMPVVRLNWPYSSRSVSTRSRFFNYVCYALRDFALNLSVRANTLLRPRYERPPTMLRYSASLNAFRVSVVMLPSAPTDSMNLAPASSLGNSEINTASYRPMVKYHV